jgi:hypothetical protein
LIKGEEMVPKLLIGGMRTNVCQGGGGGEEVVTEKEEGLGMDGMRRGHKSRMMALPTLLDITYKQDEMNIQR